MRFAGIWPSMAGSLRRALLTSRWWPKAGDRQTLPAAVRPMFTMMVGMLAELDKRIAARDKETACRAREDGVACRVMTISGIGQITATAITTMVAGRDVLKAATLPPGSGSCRSRPPPRKQKPGAISRISELMLRRLHIGSSAVMLQAGKRGAPAGSWLEGMMARKPRMLDGEAALELGTAPAMLELSVHHSAPTCARRERLHRQRPFSRQRCSRSMTRASCA